MTEEPFVILRAQILSVGTELLIGQTLDTNAHFLAQQLTELGISTYRHSLVGDNEKRLEEDMKRALQDNDLVITTGGLGPTEDDVTAEVACGIFNKKLIPMDEVTPYPAVPEGAIIFQNDNGSAPGSLILAPFEGSMKALLLLPGPPDEMEPMFSNYVKDELARHTPYSFIHRYVRLYGIGESQAERMAHDLITFQDEVTIAPYASPTEVIFRVSQRIANGEDKTEPVVQALLSLFGEHVFEVGKRPLEQVVLDGLLRRGLKVAFAESLTGGLAASTLASVPGASEVLAGGFITYNDAMKQRLLGVSPKLLSEFGAVSEEVARAMAEGCRLKTEADIAVSFTGIAGPTGGSEKTPVGTVWIGMAEKDKDTQSFVYHFTGLRNRIRLCAVYHGLNLIRKRIESR